MNEFIANTFNSFALENFMVSTWEFLVLALIFLSMLQPNAQRFLACLFYVLSIIIHHIAFRDSGGLAYYGGDAVFNLTVILLTSGMNPVTRTTSTIQLICVISIVLNFLGWLAWFLYFPPLAYDMAFLVVYALAALTFIRRDGLDAGGYRFHGWRSCIRFDLHPVAKYISKNKEKA